jgi:hypothetical protein
VKQTLEKPKTTAKNKKYLGRKRIRGFFFERIKENRTAQHEKRKLEHQWTGYISPSAQIALNMCMHNYFSHVHEFNEADEDGLELMATGTINHEGLARETRKIPGLNFAAPKLPTPDLEGWYRYIQPEVPISCDVTGFRGKCDYVLDVEGTPAPFDYKSNFPNTDEDWANSVADRFPLIKNFTQVLVYANRMEAHGYFDVPIQYFGLGHHNACAKPNKLKSKLEYWWHYDEEMKWYVQNFVYECARYRAATLGGKVPRCNYDYCSQHGNDRDIWILMQDKLVQLK